MFLQHYCGLEVPLQLEIGVEPRGKAEISVHLVIVVISWKCCSLDLGLHSH